ncbi:MAG: 2-hydroxyglutaryl-CoA dehydratase [Ruminococcaceae bacterium]|nr:2-hydroxyglutaryl-CoA dehydratase [Oscillospiraceae bacterium]
MAKEKNTASSSHVFSPPEFTKEMKATHKILAPDIFPIHMELIKMIFNMYGYDLVVLKSRGKKVIDKGLEYIHNDMCYPAICTSGQQLYALSSGEYDPHKCALIQFQTGGGCRASNYIWLLRKALHNMGMDYVPVISLSFTGMEKASGFKITPMMIAKAMVAIIYGDMLMLLRNQVRPYEVNDGDCQRVMEKWFSELEKQFLHNKGLFGKAFRKNLEAIAKDFHEIPRKNEKKTRVGIVGEIYVKYSPFGNNGLEEFLDSQDCEYMVPGVLGFFQFMFDNKQTDYRLYGKSFKSAMISRAGTSLTNRIERTFVEVLSQYPEFVTPTCFENIRALGDKVIGRGVKMGEGWLLPAEVAELIEKGYNNVICAQPFGCLPNHVVGKGTIRVLREMYPNANICPIDYDAGASRVNQENRIKLMLALARDGESVEAESGVAQ